MERLMRQEMQHELEKQKRYQSVKFIKGLRNQYFTPATNSAFNWRDPLSYEKEQKELEFNEIINKRKNYESYINSMSREKSLNVSVSPSMYSTQRKVKKFVPDETHYWHDASECRRKTRLPPIPKPVQNSKKKPKPELKKSATRFIKITNWGQPPDMNKSRLNFMDFEQEYYLDGDDKMASRRSAKPAANQSPKKKSLYLSQKYIDYTPQLKAKRG